MAFKRKVEFVIQVMISEDVSTTVKVMAYPGTPHWKLVRKAAKKLNLLD